MGLRSALRVIAASPGLAEVSPMGLGRAELASPWQRDTLQAVVWADLLGLEAFPVTRAEAMMVPAIARSRTILAGTIARIPLVSMLGGVPDDPQPSWPTRTDALSSPFTRQLWTVDDLLFHGESLWVGVKGSDGFPLVLERVPYHAWSVEDGAVVLPTEVAARTDLVVYIPGPHEGVLSFGARTIRQAAALDASALDTARHPFRVELHQLTDAPMSDEDRRGLTAAARQAMVDNAGVMFTNSAVEARVHPVDSSALLVEGRNQAAVDCARITGVPAASIDANTAGSSLTYETAEGRNRELVDFGLAVYLAAITARLSLDDVVPRGHYVAADLADFTGLSTAPTGPALED